MVPDLFHFIFEFLTDDILSLHFPPNNSINFELGLMFGVVVIDIEADIAGVVDDVTDNEVDNEGEFGYWVIGRIRKNPHFRIAQFPNDPISNKLIT